MRWLLWLIALMLLAWHTVNGDLLAPCGLFESPDGSYTMMDFGSRHQWRGVRVIGQARCC